MSAFGKLQAFKFASLLSKPFKDWDAFKLNVIDEKGNIVNKPKTSEEKKSLDAFENLVRKIKKLLIKYIPDNRLFQFLVATYLLKTESQNKCYLELIDILNEKEQKLLYSILNTSQKIY